MPRVFVHCGLHKTGTTALQQFLLSVSPSLQALGILFPRAGRLDHWGGGHHNIAWHLTHDRRYDSKWGTFDALLDEIVAHDGDVVLSSEDFETCLGTPWQFAPLLHDPRLRGREFVFIVYLRGQIAYAERQYIQNLNHRIGEDCLAVIREILERRELRVWEWRYQFDYLRMLRRMRALLPGTFVFRDYMNLVGNSVVSDFVQILSPRTVLKANMLPRSNARPQLLESLALFYVNRIDRTLTRQEALALRLVVTHAGGPPLTLASGLRRALARTFEHGNAAMCREVALDPAALALESHAAAPRNEHCFLDRVFSYETQIAVAGLAGLLPEAASEQLPPLSALPPGARAVLSGMAADWRRDDREP
jgi:hypothetical protein